MEKKTDTTKVLYDTFSKLRDNYVSVNHNLMVNHGLQHVGVKHVFGSSPRNIYSGHKLIVYTEPEKLVTSKYLDYETITGVYKK